MTTVDVSSGRIDTVWQYLTGPSHSAGMPRNLMIYNSAGGANSFNSADTFPYLVKEAKRFASGSMKNDVYTIRQSFADSELKYNSTLDVEIANELGRNLAEGFLKKRGIQREYCVFTQADGATHHLHNHIVIINPDYYGRAIAKGMSFHEIADLNDEVVIAGLKANGRNTAVQQELRSKKRTDDSRSIANATGNCKYGHYHTDNDSTKNRQYMTSVLQHALQSATSRAEFNRYLVQRNIKINRQSNENDGGWLRKNGQLKDSLSIEYDHTHMKTKTALHMTLADIDKQLAINAKTPERVGNSSTGSSTALTNKVDGDHHAEFQKAKVKVSSSADEADDDAGISKFDFSNLDSLSEVRSLIAYYKAKVEEILARQAQLRNANHKAEADALDTELTRYGVLIDMLEGRKAELKSKSKVISTAIERAKLNKRYSAPECAGK